MGVNEVRAFYNENSKDALLASSAAEAEAAVAVAECSARAGLLHGRNRDLVDVAVSVDAQNDVVTLNMTGPADVWWGVGFDAQAMKDAPWAVIVEAPTSMGGGAPRVSERQLQDQNSGTKLTSSLKIVATHTSSDGELLTVVATRALKGLTSKHYTFDVTKSSKINLINAVGSGPSLAYHKVKSPTAISLFPLVGDSVAGACLCNGDDVPFGSATGKLMYHPNATQRGENGTSGSVSFGNKCFPDLLWQKNPTCDVRSYVGGQTACHHMWSLLDADQEIPWVDTPLEYHMKFRFYVQPYNASYHTQLKRTTWGIASPVEYDVPKCAAGVKGCSKDPKSGRWIHTINGTYHGNGRLSAAHFHCHAPTCVSIKMYRNDTGELLCAEYPVYGGTGKIDNHDMDEPGFILQPPCLWGDPKFGLEPSPDVDGILLHSVKQSYADSGHHGEMAWQQMYVY
jgi:hypothetical protein